MAKSSQLTTHIANIATKVAAAAAAVPNDTDIVKDRPAINVTDFIVTATREAAKTENWADLPQ